MAPIRSRYDAWVDRHPNQTIIAVFIYITLTTAGLLVGGFWVYRDSQDKQERIAAVASAQIKQNCITSNAARESLRDLLLFARRRVVQTAPALHTPPEQVQAALDFYDQALDRIKIIPCPPPVEKP